MATRRRTVKPPKKTGTVSRASVKKAAQAVIAKRHNKYIIDTLQLTEEEKQEIFTRIISKWPIV